MAWPQLLLVLKTCLEKFQPTHNSVVNNALGSFSEWNFFVYLLEIIFLFTFVKMHFMAESWTTMCWKEQSTIKFSPNWWIWSPCKSWLILFLLLRRGLLHNGIGLLARLEFICSYLEYARKCSGPVCNISWCGLLSAVIYPTTNFQDRFLQP